MSLNHASNVKKEMEANTADSKHDACDALRVNRPSYTPKIEKLKGEQNFTVWKSMVEDILATRGVLYLVKQTPKEIQMAIDNWLKNLQTQLRTKFGAPNIAPWAPVDVDITDPRELEAQKVLARTIITTNVEPKLHSLFLFCGSKEPYDIWTTLQTKLQPKDYNAKLQVRIDLWGCKQKTNESVVEYGDRIDALALRLNELSGTEVVSDLDKISVLYRGLLPKFKDAVNAVKANETKEEKSFNQVISNFKALDVNGDNLYNKDNISLFVARGRGNFRGRGRGRGRGGFKQAKERIFSPSNREANTFRNIECYNCGKRGHIASQCRVGREVSNAQSTSKQYNNSEEKYKGKERRVALGIFSTMTRNENIWCIDSGSDAHVCTNINIFKYFKEITPIIFKVGNSTPLKASAIGEVELVSICNGNRFVLCLSDVYYCPDAPYNLIAPVKFNIKNTGLYYANGICTIFVRNADGTTTDVVKTTGSNDGFYACLPSVVEGSGTPDEHEDEKISCFVIKKFKNKYEDLLKNKNIESNLQNKHETQNLIINDYNKRHDKLRKDILLYHNINGHPNIKKTIAMMNIEIDKNFVLPVCISCQLAKSRRNIFPKIANIERRARSVGELVHTDIIGPLPPTNKYKYKYILTFIDDFSNYGTIYMLNNKSTELVAEKFADYYKFVLFQLGKQIKRLRSDNGSEYTSNIFRSLMHNHCIIHEFTNIYTPQQNGKAERYNRTLMECSNALRLEAGLPVGMWGVATDTAAYLINRLPSKSIENQIPYTLFWGRPPDDRPRAVLGCEAIVHIPKDLRSKLEAHAVRCIFVGYDKSRKGYACLGIADNKIYYSRDVIFNNTVFPCKQGRSETRTGSDALVEPSDDVKDDVDPPTLQEDTKESGDTMGSEGSEDSDVDSNVNMVDRDPMLLDPARSPLFTSNHSSSLLSHAKCSEGGDFACPILPGAYGDGSGGSNIDADIHVLIRMKRKVQDVHLE